MKMIASTASEYDAEQKVWSGPRLKDLYNSDLTIGEAVMRVLHKTPKKVIQIMDPTGDAMTAQQFARDVKVLARNLLKLQLRPKDIVGLYAGNSKHTATVLMAVYLTGAPVNPLFPGFDKDNVVLLYKSTRPKIIFCDKENYRNAQKASEELALSAKIVIINGTAEPGTLGIEDLLKTENEQELQSFEYPCAAMKGEDIALILCSSGTTGTPKGVIISHQTLLNGYTFLTSNTDSVFLCFSTLYWVTAHLNLLESLLNSALRIIPGKPFSPSYFVDLIQRHQITHVLGSSSQMAELVINCEVQEIQKSFSSIDTIITGGSKVPQMVQEKLLEILGSQPRKPGFCIIYGMSEIAGGATLNSGPLGQFQMGCEGKLLPNKRIRIKDHNGLNVGPNEKGEIQIFHTYKWAGYFQNPQATAKASNGQWLCTGDMGFMDQQGYLHVCGRDKDMFKYKGFQISPQIIEDVILRISGVGEVCVFPLPDFVCENLIACAIVRKSDKAGQILTEQRVLDFAGNNLDQLYHLKGGVYFLDALPKTSSGKVLRQKVADLAKDKVAGSSRK